MLQQNLLERLLPSSPKCTAGPAETRCFMEASADCQQVIYLVGSNPLLES